MSATGVEIVVVDGTLPDSLARSWDRFERQFDYPLDADTRFRIRHGSDPSLFFRAMGRGSVRVAVDDGEIVGSVGSALRPVVFPDGSSGNALYIGDLRLSPGRRAGVVLMRLFRSLIESHESGTPAFGLVMRGTAMTPDRYTGRLGVPRFDHIASCRLLKLSTGRGLLRSGDLDFPCVRGGVRLPSGNDALRSRMTPINLREAGASARLEDTARAKVLERLDGSEILSAHLSDFSWDDADSALRILEVARREAGEQGFPSLYCTIPDVAGVSRGEVLGRAIENSTMIDVYGTGFSDGKPWWINSSEV